MSVCNHCAFQSILADARKAGLVVNVFPAKGPMRGVDVFVHPRQVDDPREDRGRYFKAWFMELTPSCSC